MKRKHSEKYLAAAGGTSPPSGSSALCLLKAEARREAGEDGEEWLGELQSMPLGAQSSAMRWPPGRLTRSAAKLGALYSRLGKMHKLSTCKPRSSGGRWWRVMSCVSWVVVVESWCAVVWQCGGVAL